ncbi:MAG TPA: glycosyltransferase family 2 protein, partial [Micrococcaceae bacterium]
MRILRARRLSVEATVTVVIPCYNYGHFLPALVADVLAQNRVNVRVIVVDDASTDDSASVAARLAAADGRVRVVSHDSNKGHITTYNDGLALIETEFAMLLSADDLIAPDALARATDLMLANPSVGMVYGHPKDFSAPEELEHYHTSAITTWTVWRGHEWIRLACRRGRNFILSPEVVMRTAAIKEIGGYNQRLPHSGDLEYWLRTAATWDVGRINGPTQAYYRVHGQNMHLAQFATMAVDLKHRLEAFQVLDSPAVTKHLKAAPQLLARARGAMAREALKLAERELAQGANPQSAANLLDFARTVPERAAVRRRTARLRRKLRQAADGIPP